MRISDWSSDVCSSDLLVDLCRRKTAELDIEIEGTGQIEIEQLAKLQREQIAIPRAEFGALVIHHRIEPRLLGRQMFGNNDRNARKRSKSEERRVGQECVSKCLYRWCLYTYIISKYD